MESVTVGEILQATGGRLLGQPPDLSLSLQYVVTDSRSIQEGALFVPLVGQRFDGHAFIEDALSAGAAGTFTSRERERYLPGKFYILVKNTQRALRDLARYYKQRFQIPYIAVTGSVGKTTTKDMLAAVLGVKYKVLKTEGNFNNELGLPLTLLRLNRKHECAVLEMGMSSKGEIEYLSEIVEPDVAVITNIGDAHIEHLGSREHILSAKTEIFSHMKKDGIAVLNGDDAMLRTLEGNLPVPVRWCGTQEGNDCRGWDIRGDGKGNTHCKVQNGGAPFDAEIPALGDFMVYPVLMAAAVGAHLGMTDEEVARGVSDFSPTKMRMNILHRQENITILDDAYNANPQSMRAAVEVLAQAKGGYKIAILGDMFELGSLAPALHRGVGDYLGKKGIDCLIAIGALALELCEAARASGVPNAWHFDNLEDGLEAAKGILQPDCTVLVKASRGMAFEQIVDGLKESTKELKPQG